MSDLSEFTEKEVNKAFNLAKREKAKQKQIVEAAKKLFDELDNTERELLRLKHMIQEEATLVPHKHATIMTSCDECGKGGLPEIIKFYHRLYSWWAIKILCPQCGHEYTMKSFEFKATVNLSAQAQEFM